MNSKLIQIDPLLMPQPKSCSSLTKANKLNKSDQTKQNWGELSAKKIEGQDNKNKEKLKTLDDEHQSPEIVKSYNTKEETPVKTKNDSFKKVFKQQIENDDSQSIETNQLATQQTPANEQIDIEQPEKTNNSVILNVEDIIPQTQHDEIKIEGSNEINNTPATASKNVLETANLIEQILDNQNSQKQFQNFEIEINVPGKQQIEIEKGEPNQTRIIRLDNIEQEQPKNQPAEILNISANNKQHISNDAQKTPSENIDVLPSDKTNTDDGQEIFVNQNKVRNENLKSEISNNQLSSAEPKIQAFETAVNKNTVNDEKNITIPQEADNNQTIKQIPLQNAAKKQITDNIDNNAQQPKNEPQAFSSNINQLSSDVENIQIETVLAKNNESKAQTDNGAAQSVSTQTATSSLNQIINEPQIVSDKNTSHLNKNSAKENITSVREQITSSVQNTLQQGQREVTVRLNPPELGRVSIKFSEKGGELTGTLEVTNSQTRAEIQQAIPEIIRSLEGSGIIVKRIDVSIDLSRQPNQDFGRDNSPLNQWEQLGEHGYNDGKDSYFLQKPLLSNSFDITDDSYLMNSSSDYNQFSSLENKINVLI